MGAPQEFVVRLARSGGTIAVAPDETILAALQRAGIAVPSSCTAGTCGVCETRVLGGIPLHRDQIIDRRSPTAAATIMLCCSRSRSPELTLDL